ncbi:hypothetical protein BEN49_19535 [Hymenobacter coccineus]|uniref:Uncharacterized protein n=1 Tax=Hymenobacter coccineus TaxID=1908235 RepID=A0A1G1TKZ4_9BACT|nr:hypothetical protein BEN49_19535 [Hymenobacter coccineus]
MNRGNMKNHVTFSLINLDDEVFRPLFPYGITEGITTSGGLSVNNGERQRNTGFKTPQHVITVRQSLTKLIDRYLERKFVSHELEH